METNGDVFLAFIEISGFKEKLKNDSKDAYSALDSFYNVGYKTVSDLKECELSALFVADYGVIWTKDIKDSTDEVKIQQLKYLLDAIKNINDKCLHAKIMLTTSIAYGDFCYKERIELSDPLKESFLGNAYVMAFMDSNNDKPKLEPGQCRIVKNTLPIRIANAIDISDVAGGQNKFAPDYLIKKKDNSRIHYYYYWMVDKLEQIEMFEKQYSNSYNLMYSVFFNALTNAKE